MTPSKVNSILEAICAVEKAVNEKATFFAYKMPSEDAIHFGVEIADANENSDEAFVIYPFMISNECPKVEIKANMSAPEFLKSQCQCLHSQIKELNSVNTSRESYQLAFNNVHDAIYDGKFEKVVLSRVIVGEKSKGHSWSDIFAKLVETQNNAFVFIYNHPLTGAWLGATPERILTYRANIVSTMALAGTRAAKTQKEWGDKEIHEQEIVKNYVAKVFDSFGLESSISEKYTRTAGNVEHLCNDFCGKCDLQESALQVLDKLHPTPALAGYPMTGLCDFILEEEKQSRYYYGGYVGPKRESGEFDFFVNLRSLQFSGNKYAIHVGGGITDGSNSIAEWEETSNKAALLLNLLC